MTVRDLASRRAAEARGRRAERLAAWWLRLQGYRVIGQRVRTPLGEIDLVVRRGRTLAFVEVKARDRLDNALGTLHPTALARIARAATILVPRFGRGCTTIRIDAIVMIRGQWPRHYRSVWRGG